MRKCGAVLSSGYYNPPSSPELELPNTGSRKAELQEIQKERKKVFIQVSPEELNVAFGEDLISKKGRRCSDYTPRSKGQIVAYNDVWKYPRKDLVQSSSRSRPGSDLSRGKTSSRNEMVDPGEVSVHVGSPRGPSRASSNRDFRKQQQQPLTITAGGSSSAPVAIRFSPSPQRSPVHSRPSSGRRTDYEAGMQVDLSEGVQIKLNSPSPTRRNSTASRGAAAASSSSQQQTKHFHLENNPAQSVTVRTMKNVNVRTEALKDGVQFQLDGRPGVQLSVKMGQPTKGGGAMRNSIKIEAQTPVSDDYEFGGYSGSGRFGDLLSYQRPTVSHLIHARMTQLYKELRKSLAK